MQGDSWNVQIGKNDEGKVCLRFNGRFYTLAGLIVLGAAVPYIIPFQG